MGNRAALKRAWQGQRERVQKAYGSYSKKVEELEGYRGSERGDQLLQEAREQYEAALASSRATFSNEINPVLESMSDKARKAREQVTVPTEEQLRVLQAVSYIGNGGLSRRDFNRYMSVCESSDVAANALCAMANDGRIEDGGRVEAPQSGGRVSAVLTEIRLSVKSLADWDGAPRDVALKRYASDYLSGNTTRRMKANPSAGLAGAIDPTSGDFEKQVVGLKYDPELMEVID